VRIARRKWNFLARREISKKIVRTYYQCDSMGTQQACLALFSGLVSFLRLRVSGRGFKDTTIETLSKCMQNNTSVKESIG
jgi:hypothetical protein